MSPETFAVYLVGVFMAFMIASVIVRLRAIEKLLSRIADNTKRAGEPVEKPE